MITDRVLVTSVNVAMGDTYVTDSGATRVITGLESNAVHIVYEDGKRTRKAELSLRYVEAMIASGQWGVKR